MMAHFWLHFDPLFIPTKNISVGPPLTKLSGSANEMSWNDMQAMCKYNLHQLLVVCCIEVVPLK